MRLHRAMLMGRAGVAAAVIAGSPVLRGTETAATRPAAGTAVMQGAQPQYWLGVAVENIPAPIARQLKLDRDQGLMILAVLRDSPADRAGLKAEDLLVEVDGQPLTTQEQLAQAANTVEKSGDGEMTPAKPSPHKLTLLRDGDRMSIDVTPARRPDSMMVLGGNAASFQVHLRDADQGANRLPGIRNYVLPNGSALQIGPGYRMDLNATHNGALTEVSIKKILSKGQTLVLTQEQDLGGKVKNTIAVGGQSYTVEAGKIESLPPDLQPIARQLLDDSAPHAATQAGVTQLLPSSADLYKRVQDLEQKNQELQEELQDMLQALKQSKPENAGH